MKRAVAGLVLGVLLVLTLPASATDIAAPCKTVRYRRHVVAVFGTSEDLLGSVNVAWRLHRDGHNIKAWSLLRDVNAYLPTYFDREKRIVGKTVRCGL